MKASELPYVINPDGTVPCLRRTYETKDGKQLVTDVPLPKGPDDGWKEGQYEKYMRALDQKSIPMIRAMIKQAYGTTKYRLVSEVPHNAPIDVIMASHTGMLGGYQA